MAKQTFTTGQVLTAAQVNSLQSNDFNQTVSVKTAAYTLVAADKGTRIEFNTSGSVTCTVNSGLYDAGDTLVIQNRGAGVVTVTAGTATVNTSATLALSQYDAGTLYFISDSAAIFFNTDAGSGSPLTTKGDLYGFSTLDARIPIGANDTVLTADSTQSLGLKWAAPAGSGANWSLLNAGGTALTGATTITVSSISGKDKIMVVIIDASSASAGADFTFRLNADSGANYTFAGFRAEGASAYAAGNLASISGTAQTSIPVARMSSNAGSQAQATILLSGCNASGIKSVFLTGAASTNTSNSQQNNVVGGLYSGSATISSVSIISSSGNFDGGTIFVYASA